MDIPKLAVNQPIEYAVQSIRDAGGIVGYVPAPRSDYYLLLIDELHLGVLNVQLVREDTVTRWAVQVPYDTHDTVGYVLQRAGAKALL